MRTIRTALAFAVSALAGVVVASVLHSQFVLARLAHVGAVIGPADRWRMTAGDIAGLLPSYGVVLTIALAVGFLVAWILKRWLKPLAPYAYPLAGAAAVAVALALMHQRFEITPIAGARGTAGFLAQCAAGALAGLVFAWLRPSRSGS